MSIMKREGDKLLRKTGFQTPYFDSGGGQEGGGSDSGLTGLRATGFQNGVCNNDQPAFQGIEMLIKFILSTAARCSFRTNRNQCFITGSFPGMG
jgi:hypothetical protein